MDNSVNDPLQNANTADLPDTRNSLLGNLKKAAENLVNLQIVTVIGNCQISGNIQHPEITFSDDILNTDSTVIVTNINLVDSDITSVIPKKYEDQFDSPIMQYHTDQVQQANATMDQKVKLIETLLKDIIPLISG